MGADELWDTAESALEQALKNLKLNYRINAGDGAFYGPKLDVMVTDAIGRPWQLGTVQVDFNMANNFGLEFTGEDNKPHKPVVLHRAVLGSFERFIGVLIEHCEGRFPTWLSPKQVAIINITTPQEEYAKELMTTLRKLGIRAEADIRNEKLGYKIREAQLQKVPYMLILGDQEMNTKTVSVRTGKGKEIKQVSVDDFVKKLTAEIESRSLTGVFDSIV